MSIPTCPTNCDAELPDVSFNECNPEVNLSQVNKVYVTNVNAPLTDWTDPSEWTTRLSDTSDDDDAIRTFIVMGDKPLPEAQEVEISNQRTVNLNKNHTLNIAIDESNATNHAAIRNLECGPQVKFWYETIGGKMFGGTDGINGAIQLGMVLGAGSGDIQKYQGTLKWKARFTEEMIDSPLA